MQFDQSRGYGFVAAEDGGEDVFLHASVFDGDSAELVPGMKVRFQVMAGDRGRKAFAAHLVTEEPDPAEQSVPAPQEVTAVISAAADEEQMCDVLSHIEFSQELTDLLLNNIPALTGHQVLEVRHNMLELAQKHGWVDN